VHLRLVAMTKLLDTTPEEAINSAILSLSRGNLAGWELQLVAQRVYLLRNAFVAAKAYIDSHDGDPDATSEMVAKHADYVAACRDLESN
jgi:hypothetical protein